MLRKEEIKIGDVVTLANPNLMDYGKPLPVVGLTVVEKLVCCKYGNGLQTFHIDNLIFWKENQN